MADDDKVGAASFIRSRETSAQEIADPVHRVRRPPASVEPLRKKRNRDLVRLFDIPQFPERNEAMIGLFGFRARTIVQRIYVGCFETGLSVTRR